MNANMNLSESNVAIVGLGLMGGSLAMALKGHCKDLFGCDLDAETLELARGMGLFDAVESDVEAVLPRADLIVLATPVHTILELLRTIPEFLKEPAVIMDLGSTKTEIVRTMAGLPHTLDPIGGHPMTGKEKSGLENAIGDLFQGAPFALCALGRTTVRARALVEELIQVIDAKPLWMEAEIHDEWVAATSHLPYLLSVALVNATPFKVTPLVGPGFQSATRMAASNPEMMRDIFLTNQDQVLRAVRRFITKLENLERLIRAGNAKQMEDNFEDSLRRHRKFILDREEQ
jgi:prephenate dehydrogenase